MPKNKFINLLPQEEFDTSLTGRILKWAMTTFRYIVIVTELIVMGAFLSRFWLDAQNADLSDTINTEVALIESQSQLENDFRSVQSKVNIFKEMTKEPKPSEILNKVVTKMPENIRLQTISFKDQSIQVKGITNGEIGISQFIANLKAEKEFKEVGLGQINSSDDNQLLTVFSLNIKY